MPKLALGTGSKAKQNSSITTFSIPPHTATSNQKKRAQTVRVLPWGGSLYNSAQSLIQLLKNTCPIDNYLILMYVMMSDHNNFNEHLARSSDVYAKCLLEIKELFRTGRYSEGKILWLTLFPGRFNTTLPVLDL
jgi:hypothetical protein